MTRIRHVTRIGVGTAAAGALLLPIGPAAAAPGSGYRQVNLVSDVPGLARLTDADVVNPWGIALGPTTPLWVANNGTDTATIYAGANGSDPVSKVPLTVSVPHSPTGQVFNPTSGFGVSRGGQRAPGRFLFDTTAGRLASWSPEVEPLETAQVKAHVANRVYLGLALADTPDGPQLYAADGASGVDVFDRQYRLIARPGAFVDPHLESGLAPYNVAAMAGKIYVAYAPTPGVEAAVDGAIDVYNLRGGFLRRLVTGGRLDEPWGMVMAPAGWGHLGGTLLVGNEEDGRINAYDPMTGAYRGTVRDSSGKAIENDGLWGLAFGNGVFGTPQTLIFAAGIDEYEHGLIGLIRAG